MARRETRFRGLAPLAQLGVAGIEKHCFSRRSGFCDAAQKTGPEANGRGERCPYREAIPVNDLQRVRP